MGLEVSVFSKEGFGSRKMSSCVHTSHCMVQWSKTMRVPCPSNEGRYVLLYLDSDVEALGAWYVCSSKNAIPM